MHARRMAVAAAALALTTIAVMRVISAAASCGVTNDEPTHIVAGHDWLNKSSGDIEHPPLARILFALPLRAAPPPAQQVPGYRGSALWGLRGNELLGHGDYLANLFRARRGNLVFLVAMLAVVFVWTRSLYGDIAALVALALVSTLPPVLAHAALATTDMAVTAMLPIALFAALRWREHPNWPRTIVLGFAIGIGALTKFSFLPYFALAAAVLLFQTRTWARLAAALLVATIIIWAGYRFQSGTLGAAHPDGVAMARLTAGEWVAHIPIPAPLFLGGIMDVALHNDRGHLTYLLGRWSGTGWWYYFPLLLLFKTPLPFLLLAGAGIVLLLRRGDWRIALLPLAVMLPAMSSHLNLGVRHILPIYPLLALSAGYAAVALRRRWIVALLLAWHLIVTTLAHPYYLGWFNELAGRHPERIALDSNLDWGQDVLPLARACRSMGLQRIGLAIHNGSDLDRIGMPPHYRFGPRDAAHGWVAVSAGVLIRERHDDPRAFASLGSARRTVKVGTTITLYELP